MRLPYLIIIFCALFYGCGNSHKEPQSKTGDIIYNIVAINSEGLKVDPTIFGDIKLQELNTQIKLSNTGVRDLEIREITIGTPKGSHSGPTTPFSPFTLKQGNDTTLLLKFRPFNDYKLYQLTGLQGSFSNAYNLGIGYKATKGNDISNLSLKAIADKMAFRAYGKKYNEPVIAYSFNTSTDFVEKERAYLATLPELPQPPFLFLSEQEIAVSGLNFRFKNYYRRDTLHADLFIVNHSNFLVKIDPDAFDITTTGHPSSNEKKTVSVEKVSGTQQIITMIEKGDRVIIHFKKNIKITDPARAHLQLHLSEVFKVKGEKSLFKENMDLLPNSF
ncbi:hypothetical protein KXD93_05395 [Mucilaginibacter sp. BJC16-A38]|uniref:hypothetical protein n=1 Tax=Mucilaginibacter phenanthrenivorans TaxID=1234842 RepID=UPI002157E598|nr:hypothetical protein [Mucilaginibacter phenanthrenivorans]MCR8557063.1 hypothetical protein [Mucilaginibacter phenanthrenivorans]